MFSWAGNRHVSKKTVKFSDLLCVVFGFRVRTFQKCIFLFFVCLLFFSTILLGEKHIFLRVFLGESAPDPPIFWQGVSELGRGVLTR